jgi:hypothetical protein
MDRTNGGAGLNGSCMKNHSEYLDIYKYCDKLRIVVLLTKDDLLAGRALLWSIDDNITFMDRFYVAEDFMFDMMIDFAKSNGFYYKRDYKTYYNKTSIVTPDGEIKEFRWRISLDTDHSEYPYIDTFHYGGDGWISNSNYDYVYQYKNTGGGREGDDPTVWDEINDRDIPEEDAVYIERGEQAGRMTHVDSAVIINGRHYYIDGDDVVRVDGRYYFIEDGDVVEVDGQWYLEEDTCYSEFTEEHHLIEDCVYSGKHGTWIIKEDAVEVFGNYYHKDDVNEVN